MPKAPERIWVNDELVADCRPQFINVTGPGITKHTEYVHIDAHNSEVERLKKVIRLAADGLFGMVGNCDDGELSSGELTDLGDWLLGEVGLSQAPQQPEVENA